MVIKLKTEEGLEISFDTVEELMEFTQRMNEVTEGKSYEDTSEDENGVEVGDKVRIVSSDDGTDTPYHYLNVGSVGKVVGKKQFGGIVVEADGRSQCLLPHHYVKLEPSGKDDNGEGEGEFLPVGTKVRLLSNSICGDLNTGDEGTITDTDERCPMGLVYSVRVRSGEDGYGWVRREDVEVVEDEQEFKVGDKVRVVGNAHGHWMDPGEVREIKSVDSKEPKYNLSDVRNGFWAGTSDIEHVRSSTKFRTGDVVKVTESFSDILGGRVHRGAVYSYDENVGFAEPFVGTVYLGDNLDKIEMVCRAQDRLDK